MNTSSTNQKDVKILKTNTILKEKITEDDKTIKYLLNFIILGGGLGFLIVGISSYIKYNLVFFLKADQIIFFPQGLTMCFYGICGTLVGINQLRILLLKIGEGYNEFDKTKGTMNIFRKGLTGKDSDVNITYPLEEIVRNIFSKKYLINLRIAYL